MSANNNDWSTTRPGQVNSATLANAIRLFFDCKGRQPTEIGVHGRDLPLAHVAADALGLHVAIVDPPGILRGDIWLRAK
jgi:hypothetical protein